MNPQEFSQKIRTKYPNGVASDGVRYSDMDDEDLARRIVQKFPVYANRVKFEEAEPTEKPFKQKMQERAVGVVKGAIEGTVETSKLLQSLGQRVIALADPTKTLEEVRGTTGFQSLKGEMAAQIKELLGSDTPEEKQGKIAEFALEMFWPVGKTKEIAPLVSKGKELAEFGLEKGGEVLEKGKNIVQGALGEAKQAVLEVPGKIKEKITNVPKLKGEAKVSEDAIEIAREKVNPAYEERAAQEGRMSTEGRTKKVVLKPTRREELVSDSIRPLVEQGRIAADKLPFENIPEIQLEVNRINQGVKQMLAERKAVAGPFNEPTLRSKLNKVKGDSDIIFASDPTLEKTYDALVDAFVSEVRTKDIEGLFEARQNFDKLPAVKKLLDRLKGATGENLRRQAVLDIRRAANEYVSDLLPPNNPFKNALKQESYMIEAMGNLAEKSKGLAGTENYTRWLEQNPIFKTIIRNVVPFSAGGAIF